MNIKIRLVLIMLVGSLMATQAQALFKFGHINSQQLLTEMPDFEQALKAMEKMQTDGNERLKLMQGELQKQMGALQNGGATMTAAARAEKEQQLVEMQQKIQQYYQQTQQDMQVKEAELTQPIIEKAKKAIAEVGKENGFTYIFDTAKGELVHIGVESVDVLPLVRKKLGITASALPAVPSVN